MQPRQRTLAVSTLLLVAGTLYVTRLEFAPMYLMHDEVNYSLQAQSVASTGRDTNGRLLPVYFSEAGFEAGRDPLSIYATALVLTLRPLSAAAVRLPTAVVGTVSILLTFLLARRLFASDWLGLAAAAMIALTPAHFINSRLALSVVYPVPFILGWLLCLAHFAERGARRPLVAGAAILGIGIYSYLGSLVMMPLYLVLTAWLLRKHGAGRLLRPAVAAFAVALLPLILWQLAYPNRYAELVSGYRPFEPGELNTWPGAASLWEGVRLRISLFWMFFDPDFLFLSGGSRLTNATRMAGLFPLAAACLLPLGGYHIVRGRGGPLGTVILAGLLTAPLASILSGRLDINRVLFVIPFGVLTATYGVKFLQERSSSLARWSAVILVAMVPLQFMFFYADYMGRYREESAIWFGGNVRGAVEEVLVRSEAGPVSVFLNSRTPIERYWRFYAPAHNRADLVDVPVYYDPEQFDPGVMPSSSLVVCEPGSRACTILGASTEWRSVRSVTEPDGTRTFEVYERP